MCGRCRTLRVYFATAHTPHPPLFIEKKQMPEL
jgi:hypothetical protein